MQIKVAGIFLISLATLGYELALLRAFSVSQWHHFAYMAVSVALLGYGASGACISRWNGGRKEGILSRPHVFAWLFTILVPISFAVTRTVPFDVMRFAAAPGNQVLYLLLLYVVLCPPFLCAGCAVGLALIRAERQTGRVYGGNLLGSGLGACAAVGLMNVTGVSGLIVVFTIAAGAGASFLSLAGQHRRPASTLARLAALAALVAILHLAGVLEPVVSEYKSLSYLMGMPGARIIATAYDPAGRIDVVDCPSFREVAGLSLSYTGRIPQQLALVADADATSAVFRADPAAAGESRIPQTECLDYVPQALPYFLVEKPEVLVIGAGGGSDILLALRHDAPLVTAVEVNRAVVSLMSNELSVASGGLFRHERVRVVVGEGRAFAESCGRKFDIIQISLLDSFAAACAGVQALNESYLYTVEAFLSFLGALDDAGMLCVTRWLREPPADAIKLMSTAVNALERAGADSPGKHMAAVRGLYTFSLLMKKTPFAEADLNAIRRFCDDRKFDLVHIPGMRPGEENRHHRLPQDVCAAAARALLGPDRGGFLSEFPLDVAPATDGRPYFFHFLKLRSPRALLRMLRRDWIPFVEWGYVTLLATLVQAVLVSALLLLIPPRGRGALTVSTLLAGVYFICLGFGFMFTEIVFIQKFVRVMGDPVYSASVVIAAFLVFAGFGSLLIGDRGGAPVRTALLGCGCAAALILLHMLLGDKLTERVSHWPVWAKGAACCAAIAPLAFAMGCCFPAGLRHVLASASSWAPWAWAANGFSSVTGAVVATVLAVSRGFAFVMALGAALYLCAACAAWLLGRRSAR